MKYHFDLSLRSILEGGLLIDLPVSSDNVSVSTKVDTSFLQPKSSIQNMANGIVSQFRGDSSLKATATTLSEMLKNTGGFVVPGGGTFFYKNPVFNNSKDLLINAEYDG